ncbi:MAG: DUF6064 family protein [Pseudomonadota bacterium]|nr:DUF6064 family protein [Pseudomonadota bacterium]
MLPFSAEALFGQFGQYNSAIWPAPVSAFLLGALALWLLFEPRANSGRIISGILALFWAWNGAVYHLAWFSEINFLAPMFGIFFLAEGAVLLWFGVVRDQYDYRLGRTLADWTGLALVIFALAGYPLLAAQLGHVWPETPFFGVAPCPTTLFTLGVLLMMQPRVNWPASIIPLLWALTGASGAWILDIREDWSLLIAAVLFVPLAIAKNGAALR